MNLPQQDIQNLRYLLQITDASRIALSRPEVMALLDGNERYSQPLDGQLSLSSLKLLIRDPLRKNHYHTADLVKIHSFSEINPEFEKVDWYFKQLIDLIIDKFGFYWLMDKLIESMTKRYEAISAGQAEAILKRYVPFTREDSAMSSTTRSQIHRLRQKIQKYKQLVDVFHPLMIHDSDDLSELAAQLTARRLSGPYMTRNRGMIQGDVEVMGNIVQQAASSLSLEKVSQRERSPSEDIEQARKELLAKGVNPDDDLPDEDEIDIIVDHEGRYFQCWWPECGHLERYEENENYVMTQKFHHDKPMNLKLRRKRSDY